MGSAATAIVGTPSWNAQVYGSLSASSRLAALISGQTAQIKVAMFFWMLNRKVEGFLNTVDKALADAESGKLKGSGATAPATTERIEKAAGQLTDLYEILDNIHSHCVRHRLHNNSRLTTGLSQLRRNADRVEELVHWLYDVARPDFKDKFTSAEEEFEKGLTVPANEVWR